MIAYIEPSARRAAFLRSQRAAEQRAEMLAAYMEQRAPERRSEAERRAIVRAESAERRADKAEQSLSAIARSLGWKEQSA